MQNNRLFGTDGIRGLLNTEPLTVENVLRAGRALACVIKENPNPKKKYRVVIGKDTRLSGYTLETALQSGLCSMGVDVLLVGPLPTPAVAYTTKAMGADAGIMITASHNPFYDNGIKIFTKDGFKISDDDEAKIENYIYNPELIKAFEPDPKDVGRAKRIEDAVGRYIASLKSHVLKKTNLEALTIVLDCAHGAAYKVAPMLLEELGATVIRVGCEPDGKNINEGVGALYPKALAEKVQKHQASLGLALDGDGDRILAVDQKGFVFDGDDFLSIFLEAKDLYPYVTNGMVGTVMTNFGLEQKCKDLHIPFYRSNVGDRFVVEMLKDKQCSVGGETSGHILDLSRATTGDGLLSALLLLNVLCEKNVSLDAFEHSFVRFPQKLKSILVKEKKPIETMPVLQRAIEQANQSLGDRGRSLTRYSGTENKIRVMVEAKDEVLMNQVMDDLCRVVEKEIGV